MPRTFLFGLWQVPAWGYNCGYSKAYIELMSMDTTIIHYPDDKNDKARNREANAAEAVSKYLERKAQKEKNNNTTTIKLK